MLFRLRQCLEVRVQFVLHTEMHHNDLLRAFHLMKWDVILALFQCDSFLMYCSAL